MLIINSIFLVVLNWNKSLNIISLILSLIILLNSFELEIINLLNYHMEYNSLYILILILFLILILSFNVNLNYLVFHISSISLLFYTIDLLLLVLILELITISVIGIYYCKSRKISTIYYFFISGFATGLMFVNKFDISMILLISLLLKSGVAPLHYYAPYLYLNDSNNEYLSIFYLYLSSKCLLILFIKLFSLDYLIIIGIINIIIGVYYGIKWNNIFFGVLVFSSISHIGYLLLNLTKISSLYYLIQNILVTILILFILWDLLNLSNYNLLNIKLIGLNPYINGVMIISLLSLLGIPPLVGFWGKLLIIINCLNINRLDIIILVIFFSSISCVFYLRYILYYPNHYLLFQPVYLKYLLGILLLLYYYVDKLYLLNLLC